MAYNEQLTIRVRGALGRRRNVEEKRMFRGVTFMVNGKMCVSAGDETIMCRIDPALYDAVIGKKGCRPVIMKGREYRGFVYVDRKGIETKRQLDYWVGLALDFNKRAKPSKKKEIK